MTDALVISAKGAVTLTADAPMCEFVTCDKPAVWGLVSIEHSTVTWACWDCVRSLVASTRIAPLDERWDTGEDQ